MDNTQIILHLEGKYNYGEHKIDLILSYNIQIHFSNYIKEYLIAEKVITKKEDINFAIEFEKASVKLVFSFIAVLALFSGNINTITKNFSETLENGSKILLLLK